MSSVPFKKWTALMMSIILMLTICVAPSDFTPVAEAKSISDYQTELEQAKAEANAIKQKIAELKKKNAPYQQQKAAIEKQIANVQAQIDLYEADIKECKETIEARKKQLEEGKQQLKQRLVVMYTTGNTELAVLLSAADYADFLAKAELLSSVSKHDTKTITEIIGAIEELKAANAEILVAEEELKEKRAELTVAYNEVNAIVKKYNSEINKENAELADIQAEQKEIMQAIKNAQAPSGNAIVGTGQFTWPLPGCYKISSSFGPRWGRSHTGIDIVCQSGGVYGKSIVAADSGRVILSKYYSGYGNCIMIDHGNGFVTLYAHMKALSAYKVGANVNKGTLIGYVGSSGNVTGPHLHFEVIKNGAKVNPMRYFN